MAGTITPNLTLISLCDALTGWTAVGGTNALNDPTVFDQRQGTNCIQNYSASGADRGSDYTLAGATDFSNTVIYCWFAFSKVPHATNPMRIRVTDSVGNWREWNIFTKATLPHLSWIAWVVQTTVAYDNQSATAPIMTDITKVGWRMTAVVAKVYIYFDAWRYGTGLQIYGGTSADPATLENLYSIDSSTDYAYGVIDKLSGVYYIQGQIRIGSTTEAVNTYFKNTSQVMVFKNVKVASDFYDIIFLGKSGQTTEIYFGDPTTKVSGLFVKSEGAAKYKLTATDANVTKFGLYGCTFYDAGIITLPAYDVNKEVQNCNFETCAGVVVNTSTVTKCNFISSDAEAILISSISHNVTSCNFIACPVGVKIDTYNASTYPFNALIFTNCTYHVNNTCGSTLTVGNSNGSNASTYTGTLVNFVGSIDLTITVKGTVGGVENQPIVGAFAFIDQTPPESPYIMNTTTNASGVATVNWTGGAVSNSTWRIRKYGYKDFKQAIDIASVNISLPVTLIVDPQQT